MYRIDNDTAAEVLPAPTEPGPKPDGYFTGGNPQTGTPATIVDAEWANMIQEEIANVIEAAGGTLDKAENSQLFQAVASLIIAAMPEVPPSASLLGSRNMLVTNDNASPASKLTVMADEVVVKDAGGEPHLLTGVDVAIDMALSGAGGLDTGIEGSSRFYYGWVIWNGTNVSAVASESATSPTMPSGYTHKALVTAVYNDGSSNFRRFFQRDNFIQAAESWQLVAGGTATSRTSVGLSAFVPPASRRVAVEMQRSTPASAGQVTATLFTRDDSTAGALNAVAFSTGAAQSNFVWGQLMMETAQTFYYLQSAGGSTDIWLRGFYL